MTIKNIRTGSTGATSLAAGITNSFGMRSELARERFMLDFDAEHRLEHVATTDSIRYVNDCRSTNPNATWYALEQTIGPIVWIGGGIDRGSDYSVLKEVVAAKVRAIICLAVDETPFHKAFYMKPIIHVTSMAEALAVARKMVWPKDTVLISPACASFDLFENYEEKGRSFKQCVYNY